MQYRPFGKLDWKASALGFGCMRLPIIGGDSAQIDEPEAIRMLHYAIDHGVNYLDTAYPYHGGNSERVVGKALQGGYRDRVHVATKLPAWAVNGPEDFDRLVAEQMAKLQVEHIDFYLLHGMRAERWGKMLECKVLEQADRALDDGRIGHLGFSFHDNLDMFRQIIDAYDRWSMCQIQYNYMNEQYQAGTAGLEYAASKGLAVVVMEPLLGGKLVEPPSSIQDLWSSAPVTRSPVEWAFTWLWSKPQVSVVLSGMNKMEQVEQNVALASSAAAETLSPAEIELVRRVKDKYDELCPIPCTQCRYCMPCPNGVDIPRNFATLNNAAMYNAFDEGRRRYMRAEEASRASACIACRTCEDLCPQTIEISAWMPVIHQVLGEGRAYEECELPR